MNVRINRGHISEISHGRRLHHLREMARKLDKITASPSMSHQSQQAAAFNLDTVRWAIEQIEAHPPEAGK